MRLWERLRGYYAAEPLGFGDEGSHVSVGGPVADRASAVQHGHDDLLGVKATLLALVTLGVVRLNRVLLVQSGRKAKPPPTKPREPVERRNWRRNSLPMVKSSPTHTPQKILGISEDFFRGLTLSNVWITSP